MEEITLTGIFTGTMVVITIGTMIFAILGTALIILDIGDRLRIFWNHEILRHGKAPVNPTQISLIRTPFFRVKEAIVDKNVAEIIGVDLDLRFKNSTNPIYVKFSRDIIQNFVQGHIYDRHKLKSI